VLWPEQGVFVGGLHQHHTEWVRCPHNAWQRKAGWRVCVP
jgi:hypothetical protein